MRCPLLDHRYLEPELRGANGANIPARSSANDDQVVRRCHHWNSRTSILAARTGPNPATRLRKHIKATPSFGYRRRCLRRSPPPNSRPAWPSGRTRHPGPRAAYAGGTDPPALRPTNLPGAQSTRIYDQGPSQSGGATVNWRPPSSVARLLAPTRPRASSSLPRPNPQLLGHWRLAAGRAVHHTRRTGRPRQSSPRGEAG